jgi:hypothetical protein
MQALDVAVEPLNKLTLVEILLSARGPITRECRGRTFS